MLRVAVGSSNPAKVKAVQAAFEALGHQVHVVGFDVESGVSAQPFSDEETVEGALNRAKAAIHMQSDQGPFELK
ncbi:DUF84 family protein [Effusibacillus lacus]|uniref:inosine/xanthosine triphosphatase n=1 Tax=Effusibacillus lacus TaxID=1348429 RepID=A0A292YMT3_9BACL|nr:DUF84 family protein [Effusibacillus lacus]TCS72313.1 uncharacterized protein DUF84 [Effusibacillus lacus]GAX90221.1 NTPase [Effusibacillus lacus]